MDETNQEQQSQGSYYNPEWLQVSCEERQGVVNVPQYDNEDDGLIAGVDFPEDNPPATLVSYQHDYTDVMHNGQPVAMDPMFPWPANTEPNEEPLPRTPIIEPRTPSIRWALQHHQQAQRSWSLRSSDIASCSSLTPDTTISYRDSPSNSCLSAMVQNYLHDAAVNKQGSLGLRPTAAHGHSTVRLSLQSRPGFQDTPSSNASPLSVHRFLQRTPTDRRTSTVQHDRPQHDTRTPQRALQQKRKVDSSSNGASSYLAGNQGTVAKRREGADLQQFNIPDARSLQPGHQNARNVPSTPYGSLSVSGRNVQQDAARHEQPGVTQTAAEELGESHHNLQFQRDIQATPKVQETPVTTQEQLDLVKNAAECTIAQHVAEQGARTPMSILQQRKPIPAIHTPAEKPERKTAPTSTPRSTPRPRPSLQDKGKTRGESSENKLNDSSQEVTQKSTETTAGHPCILEVRDMDSFYKSAWVRQLQRAQHRLFMEEIKAQILYEPPNHFSIMSAFEDIDDPFIGHKSRRSSLQYRTLDDELRVLSSSNSPVSQGVTNGARMLPGVQGRPSHRNDQDTVPSAKSTVKKIPLVEAQRRTCTSPSMQWCHGVDDHSGHATYKGALPISEMESVLDSRTSSPQGSDKLYLAHQTFSQESDIQRNPNCPFSKNESQKQAAAKNEQGRRTSPKAILMTAVSGDIVQHSHTAGRKSVDTPHARRESRCSCGVPKADKACQIQPDVITAATSCDDKTGPDPLQAGDNVAVQLAADSN